MKNNKQRTYDITGFEIKDNNIIVYYSNATSEIIKYTKENEIKIINSINTRLKLYIRKLRRLKNSINYDKDIIDNQKVYTIHSTYHFKDENLVESSKENIYRNTKRLKLLEKKLLFLKNERLINGEILRQFNYLNKDNNSEANLISVDDLNNYTISDLKEIIESIKSSKELKRTIN